MQVRNEPELSTQAFGTPGISLKYPGLFVATFLFLSACAVSMDEFGSDRLPELLDATESADAVMVGLLRRSEYFLGGGQDYFGFQYQEVLKGPTVHWRTSLLFDRDPGCEWLYEPEVSYVVLSRMKGGTHFIDEYCDLIVEATDEYVSQIRKRLSGDDTLVALGKPDRSCAEVIRYDRENSRLFAVCPELPTMEAAEIGELVRDIFASFDGPPDEYFVSFFATERLAGYKTEDCCVGAHASGEWSNAYLGEYYTHSNKLTLWPALASKRLEVPL